MASGVLLEALRGRVEVGGGEVEELDVRVAEAGNDATDVARVGEACVLVDRAWVEDGGEEAARQAEAALWLRLRQQRADSSQRVDGVDVVAVLLAVREHIRAPSAHDAARHVVRGELELLVEVFVLRGRGRRLVLVPV